MAEHVLAVITINEENDKNDGFPAFPIKELIETSPGGTKKGGRTSNREDINPPSPQSPSANFSLATMTPSSSTYT